MEHRTIKVHVFKYFLQIVPVSHSYSPPFNTDKAFTGQKQLDIAKHQISTCDISNIWQRVNRKPPFRHTGDEAWIDEGPDFHPMPHRPSAWECIPLWIREQQVRGQESRMFSHPTKPTLCASKQTCKTEGLKRIKY